MKTIKVFTAVTNQDYQDENSVRLETEPTKRCERSGIGIPSHRRNVINIAENR